MCPKNHTILQLDSRHGLKIVLCVLESRFQQNAKNSLHHLSLHPLHPTSLLQLNTIKMLSFVIKILIETLIL